MILSYLLFFYLFIHLFCYIWPPAAYFFPPFFSLICVCQRSPGYRSASDLFFFLLLWNLRLMFFFFSVAGCWAGGSVPPPVDEVRFEGQGLAGKQPIVLILRLIFCHY